MWRLWWKEAFTRWHTTFENSEATVSEVLDHLKDYRDESTTLMTANFPGHSLIVRAHELGPPRAPTLGTAGDLLWTQGVLDALL
jgi:hypothetical protein